MYRNPFTTNVGYGVLGFLVLCETYEVGGEPHLTNNRAGTSAIFKNAIFNSNDYWFGLEQEFFLIDVHNNKPLGFPQSQAHNPEPQGQFYCAVGGENAFGREIVEKAYMMSHYAGLNVSGMNAEVAPGQWEIQVGIAKGIKAGDDIWMLRYILGRVTEEYQGNCRVDFRAKPVLNYYGEPDTRWNGSGLHTNFSNPLTRGNDEKDGMEEIKKAIERLSQTHEKHIDVYGDDNELRLTGKLETSSINSFTYSIGGRGVSIRIPNEVAQKGKGYFEDRRPSSSADPYLIIGALVESTDPLTL